jgi:hypothetical protein
MRMAPIPQSGKLSLPSFSRLLRLPDSSQHNKYNVVTAFTDVVGITIAGIRCLHKALAGGQPLEPNSYLHLLRASLYPIFCPPNPHSLVITVHQSKPRNREAGGALWHTDQVMPALVPDSPSQKDAFHGS